MSFHIPALGVCPRQDVINALKQSVNLSLQNHRRTLQQQCWNDRGLKIHYSDFQMLLEHVLITNAQRNYIGHGW
ncbi:unnamed protein product [Urochloa humidicola]